MSIRERWFEIGEPTENDRVDITVTTSFDADRGEENRTDDHHHGTIEIEALDLLEEDQIAEHVQDDETVNLSDIPTKAEEELLDTFEGRR